MKLLQLTAYKPTRHKDVYVNFDRVTTFLDTGDSGATICFGETDDHNGLLVAESAEEIARMLMDIS